MLGGTSFVDHLCYLCLVFFMLSRLFIAALWSVTCWERADLLALVCDVLSCFCHFPMWYPGSGVVLGCIDSRSLPPFLLCQASHLLF